MKMALGCMTTWWDLISRGMHIWALGSSFWFGGRLLYKYQPGLHGGMIEA
jgi:hypothetical protein